MFQVLNIYHGLSKNKHQHVGKWGFPKWWEFQQSLDCFMENPPQKWRISGVAPGLRNPQVARRRAKPRGQSATGNLLLSGEFGTFSHVVKTCVSTLWSTGESSFSLKKMVILDYWLVVSNPLKNMSSSVGMIIRYILKNKSHVPNHQPD